MLDNRVSRALGVEGGVAGAQVQPGPNRGAVRQVGEPSGPFGDGRIWEPPHPNARGDLAKLSLVPGDLWRGQADQVGDSVLGCRRMAANIDAVLPERSFGA